MQKIKTQGVFQILLKTESRKYTAFIFEGRAYQFCRIPFGIKTASNGFVRTLNTVLGNDFYNFLTIYVDNMLITSQTFDEHLEHLDKILTRLGDVGLFLKLS